MAADPAIGEGTAALAGRDSGRARVGPKLRAAAPALATALALVLLALIPIGGSLSGPVHWTPDGLFYQARSLELRGASDATALARVFDSPQAAELRRIDPTHVGDRSWVTWYSQFYDRRLTVPLAGAALKAEPANRVLLNISLAGYLAAVLAIFGLLLIRFRLAIAGTVTAATIFLPALVDHSSFPLTDSWGVALMTAALATAILALDRTPRWLFAWVPIMLVLACTRDTAWIPLLAVIGVALLRRRSRTAWTLAATGLAAMVPVLLLFPLPMREVLASGFNGFQAAPDPSWSYVLHRYPHALVDYLQADGGFVRDGAWYSALFLLIGLAALWLLGRGTRGGTDVTVLRAASLAALAYVLSAPLFSAFRLELVFVPMAAFGLALAAERALERLRARTAADADADAPAASAAQPISA